ncbi:ATP-binding cassette domain-containing protein [Paenibacillus validus]|uniref:ATP-binding cassette domain-containing protein n=1 Tax=Paenibacillus validus TaxID=44253 RepID=A0A7X2ZDC5_9BACL|nr:MULTISPECIES: ATP-binding cassette domain-containing protein [Paenibacillus]MED4601157.1 ATP-binding cassette domain-containing protein [Paenibacillus validus]MED4606875.1 ATP-binding cassette domain-containing protein [Paenibacillus validus]MUG72768.1 ATP-binding cassette domain-containing protein [Paenibacillus validus]
MTLLVETKNLSKTYSITSGFLWKKPHRFKAVDGVDLAIRSGEIVGLIGESGSGKSTLGRLIARLIQPSEGSVYFDGKDITNLSHKELIPYYRRMQVIFQDSASSLNPRKTIGEQIVTPMLRMGIANHRSEAEFSVYLILEKVGLKKEHFTRYPHEFSGGQRQRIGIARALAVQAEFLILDEPTSALDVSIQAQILNLLLDLREELNLTYLFIGHNLAVIEFFCDRVAVMDKGRVVEMLPADELYERAVHPSTRKLVDSVLSLDPGVQRYS